MAQESFDLVKGCQDGIPKTTFSVELTRRIKEVLVELGEGLDVSNILFYTAITSPELKDPHGRHFISSLDALYGVDAFIDLVLPQGIVRVTLDGSYKYKDFVKAD
jgi:hypothetical protein